MLRLAILLIAGFLGGCHVLNGPAAEKPDIDGYVTIIDDVPHGGDFVVTFQLNGQDQGTSVRLDSGATIVRMRDGASLQKNDLRLGDRVQIWLGDGIPLLTTTVQLRALRVEVVD
jgi:hypothetical protein